MSRADRQRGIVVLAIALITVIAALIRRPRSAPLPRVLQQVPPASVSPVPDRPRARPLRWLVVLLALGSTAWCVGLTAEHESSPHVEILVGTAAIVVSVFGLRGPRVRYPTAVGGLLIGCGLLGVGQLLTSIVLSADPADGDIYLLVASALCAITAVGAIAWLASTWHVGGDLLEPVALVATAAVLGGVSLIGLYSAGTAINSVQVYGSGDLYLSAPDVDAELDVSTLRPEWYPDGTNLGFVINAPGAERWALVLTAGAKIHADTVDGDPVTVLEVHRPDPPNFDDAPQILTGPLRDGRAVFSAHLRAPIAARSASRAAVTFPRYGAGSGNDLDGESGSLLTSGTGANVHAPGSLHIELDAGVVFGLETVTQADPPLGDPRHLRWESDSSLGPVSYATFDQGADDIARNKLFTIAIFLGTAAACLISAMQSMISRRTRAT